ncbi:hypothetical protein ACFSSF_10425 [Dietzia aerolata]
MDDIFLRQLEWDRICGRGVRLLLRPGVERAVELSLGLAGVPEMQCE